MPLQAQLSDGSIRSFVSGTVTWEGEEFANSLQVQLKESGGREAASADVRSDGTFFLPAGEVRGPYILQVWDRRGHMVHEELVHPTGGPVRIELQAPRKERPVEGVVSAEELLHPVPKEALREFARAQKDSRRGQIDSAIGHLQKAVRIHPQFAAAHNGLGVKYMILRDFARAAESFAEALRLRPGGQEPLGNLAMALHGLGRYDEAESLVRRAIAVDPRSVRARYGLALVLIAKGGDQQEARQILGEVAGQIPEAHMQTAALLAGHGDYRGAAREISAYLDSGEKKHREMAEKWRRNFEAQARLTAADKPGRDVESSRVISERQDQPLRD
jgi:tetratricopeptide (TPR) repeat protein